MMGGKIIDIRSYWERKIQICGLSWNHPDMNITGWFSFSILAAIHMIFA
jgi:hypothetical protein